MGGERGRASGPAASAPVSGGASRLQGVGVEGGTQGGTRGRDARGQEPALETWGEGDLESEAQREGRVWKPRQDPKPRRQRPGNNP